LQLFNPRGKIVVCDKRKEIFPAYVLLELALLVDFEHSGFELSEESCKQRFGLVVSFDFFLTKLCLGCFKDLGALNKELLSQFEPFFNLGLFDEAFIDWHEEFKNF
jgi:hypothetical protein